MIDGTKKLYWNHLFWSNLIIAVVLVLIIRQILEFNLSPDILNVWLNLKLNSLYTIIATIAGTLLGFIITSISIIVAFTESDKLEILRESDHYTTLFNIYFNTIKILAITTIVAVIGIIDNSGNIFLFYISLISTIMSALFIWACIWALESIIDIVK